MSESKKTPSRPERFFSRLFRLFNWLDSFRERHPVLTKVLISGPFAALIIWMIHVHIKLGSGTPWAFLDFALKAGVGLLVSEGFLRGVVPLQKYSWQAISMREMGLELVVTNHKSFCRTVGQFISQHPNNERIRVICISGKYLFRESHTPSGEECPLHLHARAGNLDVVMPVSDPKNATILGRFETYNEKFKKAEQYHSIQNLVEEIIETKKALSRNLDNVIIEHNILCMWRVVLLKDYCIVQTYFPNNSGGVSNDSPIFVFKRISGPNAGYYATFESMFKLVERHASANASSGQESG